MRIPSKFRDPLIAASEIYMLIFAASSNLLFGNASKECKKKRSPRELNKKSNPTGRRVETKRRERAKEVQSERKQTIYEENISCARRALQQASLSSRLGPLASGL